MTEQQHGVVDQVIVESRHEIPWPHLASQENHCVLSFAEFIRLDKSLMRVNFSNQVIKPRHGASGWVTTGSKHEALWPHLASQENPISRVTKFAWPDQELVRVCLGDQVIKWRCMPVWLGDGREKPLDLCTSLGITRNSCGSSLDEISRPDQEFNRSFLRSLNDRAETLGWLNRL